MRLGLSWDFGRIGNQGSPRRRDYHPFLFLNSNLHGTDSIKEPAHRSWCFLGFLLRTNSQLSHYRQPVPKFRDLPFRII